MILTLTEEQAAKLGAASEARPTRVIDPTTRRHFVLVPIRDCGDAPAEDDAEAEKKACQQARAAMTLEGWDHDLGRWGDE